MIEVTNNTSSMIPVSLSLKKSLYFTSKETKTLEDNLVNQPNIKRLINLGILSVKIKDGEDTKEKIKEETSTKKSKKKTDNEG